MKSVEFRPWDLPDKYDPDYKLFLQLPPPEFKLLPPLATHLETLLPAYGEKYHPYTGDGFDPEIHLEVRRTGKKRFSVASVKSPGGFILRKLANFKTREEAESALRSLHHDKT